jgi:hypothetical protein
MRLYCKILYSLIGMISSGIASLVVIHLLECAVARLHLGLLFISPLYKFRAIYTIRIRFSQFILGFLSKRSDFRVRSNLVGFLLLLLNFCSSMLLPSFSDHFHLLLLRLELL